MTDKNSTACVIDTVRWFERRDDGVYIGYSVECVAKDHNHLPFGACPGEHDLFEKKVSAEPCRP